LESFQKKIQSELRKVTDETYTLRSKVEEIGILMEQQQKEIEFYENVVADIKRSYDEQHSVG
jgi:peptidoglycan hydrolase CwlO-like protein